MWNGFGTWCINSSHSSVLNFSWIHFFAIIRFQHEWLMLNTSLWLSLRMWSRVWLSTFDGKIMNSLTNWCASRWSSNGFRWLNWITIHPKAFSFTNINVECSSWIKISA